MSNPYTGSVASALRKAELLLGAEASPGLQRAAVQDGALLQLWRAYRAFLLELSFQLQLGAEPETAAQLQQLAASRGKTSSEAGELLELLGDPGSWLARLRGAWEQLWRFNNESAAGNGGQRPQTGKLIPVQNLAVSAPVVVDEILLREWQSALTELVRRQRAQTEEW
jgi:hypothetical protein